jgi:DNA-binding MarR family transcriptional regulator
VVRFQLEDADYQRLLGLRTSLRQYLHWSEQQAQAVGLTPAHHQFLLAVRGHDDPRGPTISDVAGYLLLKHHSTVELAQRVGALGLVDRFPDSEDGRVVRLRLTEKGAAALEKLTILHLEELSRLATGLGPIWQGHLGPQSPGPQSPGPQPPSA